MYTAHVKFTVA